MSASLQRGPLPGGCVTLRGRLTTAFLVVVLGPVLLGSIFVALTVATVGENRTADQLVGRGLATDIRILPALPIAAGNRSKPTAGDNWQDCAAPTGGPTGAIAATATVDTHAITAAQTVDAAFLERLGAAGGARVT